MAFGSQDWPGSGADLRRLPVFAPLTDEQLARVFDSATLRKMAKGSTVNLTRQFAGRTGIVWSGLFATSIALAGRRVVTLSRLKPGACFTRDSLVYGRYFGDGHRLTCVKDGSFLEFSGEKFAEFVDAFPSLSQALILQVSLLAADYASRLYESQALNALERVQAEVLRRARDGEWIGRTVRIEPRPTHHELAGQIGVAREVATRCLSVLVGEGLIRFDDDALEVIDVDRLLERDRAATGRLIFDPSDQAKGE